MGGLRIFSKLLFPLAFLVVVVACSSRTLYQNSLTISPGGWQAGQVVEFEVEITDTMQLYEIYMLVRNTTDYPYSNLYLFLDIEFPDRRLLRDTLECALAERDGRWTGRGFGRFRSNRFFFRDNVWFPAPGPYHFRVQHGMREDVLRGVSDIGLRIEKK